MRYSCKASVEYDLKMHYQLHDKYLNDINDRSLFKGYRLKTTLSADNGCYYAIKSPQSNKYVYAGGGDSSDVQGIREYAYYDKAISIIEKNIVSMENFLNIYRDTNADSLNELLSKAYRLPRNEVMLVAEPEIDNWIKKNEAKKASYPVFDPAGLKVTSFDGTRVRSRAEAIHYEAFFIYNIPSIFELPYKIGNEVYRPDFTSLYVYMMRDTMWEHLGNWFHSNMHKRQQYRNESIFRWDEYGKIGFYPDSNLMLTFGISENNFDAQAIHRKIAAFAMPPPSDETISILRRC